MHLRHVKCDVKSTVVAIKSYNARVALVRAPQQRAATDVDRLWNAYLIAFDVFS